MFLTQDYNPIDRSFGPPLSLPAPKEYGVPEGYDIPIFRMFAQRDIERIEPENVVVFRKKKRPVRR